MTSFSGGCAPRTPAVGAVPPIGAYPAPVPGVIGGGNRGAKQSSEHPVGGNPTQTKFSQQSGSELCIYGGNKINEAREIHVPGPNGSECIELRNNPIVGAENFGLFENGDRRNGKTVSVLPGSKAVAWYKMEAMGTWE
jgi:hypothetical protein